MTYKTYQPEPRKAWICDVCGEAEENLLRVGVTMTFHFGRVCSSYQDDQDNRHVCLECRGLFLSHMNALLKRGTPLGVRF